jgi:hypothetical protein
MYEVSAICSTDIVRTVSNEVMHAAKIFPEIIGQTVALQNISRPLSIIAI